VGGNGVGQTSGFINIGDRSQDFRRDLFVELDVLVKLGNDGTAQRFDLPPGNTGCTRATNMSSRVEIEVIRPRCVPSTSTLTVPSGSLSICKILATHPIS